MFGEKPAGKAGFLLLVNLCGWEYNKNAFKNIRRKSL
jgi:hypothetical protein